MTMWQVLGGIREARGFWLKPESCHFTLESGASGTRPSSPTNVCIYTGSTKPFPDMR